MIKQCMLFFREREREDWEISDVNMNKYIVDSNAQRAPEISIEIGTCE